MKQESRLKEFYESKNNFHPSFHWVVLHSTLTPQNAPIGYFPNGLFSPNLHRFICNPTALDLTRQQRKCPNRSTFRLGNIRHGGFDSIAHGHRVGIPPR